MENKKNIIMFSENYDLDVSKLVEKKGKFNYISWSHCQQLGKKWFHEFTWRMVPFINTQTGEMELLWGKESAYFVKLEMTINGITEEHMYLVTDNMNKPIQSPNATHINNSQMRGFAKLFSMMTGAGLKLYTGEDLTQYDYFIASKITSHFTGEDLTQYDGEQEAPKAPTIKDTTITKEQEQELVKFAFDNDKDLDAVLKFYKVSVVGELKEDQYKQIMGKWNA